MNEILGPPWGWSGAHFVIRFQKIQPVAHPESFLLSLRLWTISFFVYYTFHTELEKKKEKQILRQELLHWSFVEGWNGYLPWKDERHASITLFSDASDVDWGCVVKVSEGERKTLRGYCDDKKSELWQHIKHSKSHVMQ